VTTRYGATLHDVEAVLAARGEPPYRARQVHEGLWSQRRPLEALTAVPKALRADLARAIFRSHSTRSPSSTVTGARP